jgi:hypothetical protein
MSDVDPERAVRSVVGDRVPGIVVMVTHDQSQARRLGDRAHEPLEAGWVPAR